MELFNLFGTVSVNGIDKITSQLDNVGAKLMSVGQSISNFGTGLTNRISKPLADMVLSGVKYNATMEEMNANFSVMLGSQDKAIALSKKLVDMGAATPFEATELARSTETLLNFGYTGDQVIPIMSKLGDVSLGNNVKFQSMSRTMGQINALGRLQGGDLNQLINQGWNPLNNITKKTGETMEQVRKRMSEGKVSYKEVEQALDAATSAGGRYHKGMEVGSRTLNGLLSTLTDTWNMLIGELTKPIFDGIKQALPIVIDLFGKLQDRFVGLDSKTKLVILAMVGLGVVIPPLIVVFGTVISMMGFMVIGLSSLLSPITLVVGGLTLLTAGLGTAGLLGGLLALKNANLSGFFKLLDTLKSKAGSVLGWLKEIWTPAIKYLLSGDTTVLSKIKDEEFRDSLTKLRRHIEQWSGKIEKAFGSIEKGVKKIDKKKITSLSTALVDMADALMTIIDIGGKVLSFLSKFEKATKDFELNLFKPLKSGKKLDLDGVLGSDEELSGKAKRKAQKTMDGFNKGVLSKAPQAQAAFKTSSDTKNLDNTAAAFSKAHKTLNSYKSGILNKKPAVSSSFQSVASMVSKLDKTSSARSKGSKTGAGYASGVKSKTGAAGAAGTSLGNAAKNKSGNVSLYKSGSKIGRSLANGLLSAIDWVGNAASKIANKISSFFPSSPAKDGALRSIPKWMPTMVDMMNDGLLKGKDKLAGTSKLLAKGIASGISSTTDGITIKGESLASGGNRSSIVHLTLNNNISKNVDVDRMMNTVVSKLSRYGLAVTHAK